MRGTRIGRGESSGTQIGGDQAHLETIGAVSVRVVGHGGQSTKRQELQPGRVDDQACARCRLGGLPDLPPPQWQGEGVCLTTHGQNNNLAAPPGAEYQLFFG